MVAQPRPQDDVVVPRPEKFNFAVDIVDYWATQPGNLMAMYWVSQDESTSKTLTFDHFSRQSNRVSVLLEHLGVKEGETMIMVLPRVPAWQEHSNLQIFDARLLIRYNRWEIALATIRSGIILSPATTLSTEKDIQYRTIKSKATVFVGDIVSVKKFLAIREKCPFIRTIIQVGDVSCEDVVPFYPSLESIEGGAKVNPVRRHWNYPALTYFTSGTSGEPKMVRHNQISYPLGKARNLPNRCPC
jgi:acyl-coenzyme A synthetase/AMP-(fatty) acid ligase